MRWKITHYLWFIITVNCYFHRTVEIAINKFKSLESQYEKYIHHTYTYILYNKLKFST